MQWNGFLVVAMTTWALAQACTDESCPSGPDYLLMKAPADVLVGEPFAVEVQPMQFCGEVAEAHDEQIEVFVEGHPDAVPLTTDREYRFLGEGSLSGGTISTVAILRLDTPGWYRLAATDGGTTTYLPVRGHVEPPERRLFWGEMHTHSSLCGDASTEALGPAGAYAWGKNVAGLDFGTVVAHHWSLDPSSWQHLKQSTHERNEPGRFVTLLGYEWAEGSERGRRRNHHNVYFLGDDAPLAPDMNSVSDLWSFLDEHTTIPTLAIAHHPAHRRLGTDWASCSAKYMSLAEIYSQHGNSEGGNTHLQGVCTSASGLVQKGFGKGCVLGVIAGGDNHGGRMGTNSYIGKRKGSDRTGLAAVLAEDLTRAGLWGGFRRRSTYGTTGGQKILLDFRVDGHGMGTEYVRAPGPRRIHVQVGGTQQILSVEVIKNGDVLHAARGDGWHETVEIEDPCSGASDDYYYARVTQSDGNMAWSSPVWVSSQ